MLYKFINIVPISLIQALKIFFMKNIVVLMTIFCEDNEMNYFLTGSWSSGHLSARILSLSADVNGGGTKQ